MNHTKRWNLLICYNPSFITTYYKSLFYIGKIKDSLLKDDLISMFSYEGTTLKRSINKKTSGTIDLDENVDSFLNVRHDLKMADETNFIQRFKTFLVGGSHTQTDNMLKTTKFKNLVIAFTTEKEWKKSEFDNDAVKFIEQLKIKNKDLSGNKTKDDVVGSSYKLSLILVVFNSVPCLRGNIVSLIFRQIIKY